MGLISTPPMPAPFITSNSRNASWLVTRSPFHHHLTKGRCWLPGLAKDSNRGSLASRAVLAGPAASASGEVDLTKEKKGNDTVVSEAIFRKRLLLIFMLKVKHQFLSVNPGLFITGHGLSASAAPKPVLGRGPITRVRLPPCMISRCEI